MKREIKILQENTPRITVYTIAVLIVVFISNLSAEDFVSKSDSVKSPINCDSLNISVDNLNDLNLEQINSFNTYKKYINSFKPKKIYFGMGPYYSAVMLPRFSEEQGVSDSYNFAFYEDDIKSRFGYYLNVSNGNGIERLKLSYDVFDDLSFLFEYNSIVLDPNALDVKDTFTYDVSNLDQLSYLNLKNQMWQNSLRLGVKFSW